MGELCWVDWLVDRILQKVVQTAMSAVVRSGTNAEKI